jgi:uncharacterized protein (TIGR01777 family)
MVLKVGIKNYYKDHEKSLIRKEMKKILITGGSGMIGTRLTRMLLDKKYEVVHLGRGGKNSEVPSYVWDIPAHKIEARAFEGVDTIIHLAGANVGDKRWTNSRKKEILESRTHSTRLLCEYLRKEQHGVKNFVSASAIGYYGFGNDDKLFTEVDSPGSDFLADVVKRWEAEVDEIVRLGIRTAKVRVGIVLSREEGVLKEIARTVKFHVGAPLGKGTQQLSWIHIDDVCRVFLLAAEKQSLSGPVNAVAPNPVSNADLTKAIAITLGRKVLLPPVPGFLLRMVLGEMADLAVNGNHVSNEKLMKEGFTYKFPDLHSALVDLLRPGKQ